jgi:hypothetical protein
LLFDRLLEVLIQAEAPTCDEALSRLELFVDALPDWGLAYEAAFLIKSSQTESVT